MPAHRDAELIEKTLLASSIGHRPGAAGQRPRGASSLLLPAVSAIVVSAALTFLAGFQYPCTAIFQLDSNESPAPRHVEQQLASFMTRLAAQNEEAPHWTVRADASQIKLQILANNRQEGLRYTHQLSAAFIDSIAQSAAKTRSIPTEIETAFEGHIARLESRLSKVQNDAQRSLAALPIAPVDSDRDAVAAKWRIARGDLQDARLKLTEAAAGLAQLKSNAAASGLVTNDDRRAAIADEPGLAQDLGELKVNLAEVKNQLQLVGSQTAEALSVLHQTAEEFAAAAVVADADRLDAPARDRLEKLQHQGAQAASMIASFQDHWSSGINHVSAAATDPHSGELLDAHMRLRKQASDFLYAASQRLTTIRTLVTEINQTPKDDARHHVLHAHIVRAHQAFQDSFHRVEFAAGQIENPENFRLDAALRSARGLRRRTQDRLRVIEQKLSQHALDRAKKEHEEAVAKAQELIDRLQSDSQRDIDELLATQDDLNSANDKSEEYLRSAMRAEIVLADVRALQQNLAASRDHLKELSEKRAATDFTNGLKLVEVMAEDRPANLHDLLWSGSLAAMCTFLTVFLGQLFLTQRR